MLVKLIRYYKLNGIAMTAVKVSNLFILRWHLAFLAINKFLNKKSVLSKYGVRLTANWEDKTFFFCALGTYGNDLADFLKSQSSDYIFIDIGANQGLYSLIADKVHNCKAIVAFEPVRKTFEMLNKNIDINNAIKIKAHNVAISNKEKEIGIFVPNNHSGSATLRKIKCDLETGNIEVIKSVSNVSLNFMIPNFKRYIVKIDVEGHELIVLSELFKTNFCSRISHIFYEVDKNWVNSREIETLLKKNGFNNFDRIGADEIHYDVLASK